MKPASKKSRTEETMVSSPPLSSPQRRMPVGKGKSHVDSTLLVLPVDKVNIDVPQSRVIEESREGSESFESLRTEDVASDDEGGEVVREATPIVDDEANLDKSEVALLGAEVTIGDTSVARVDKGKRVINFEAESPHLSPSAGLLEKTMRGYYVKPLVGTPKSHGKGPVPMVEDPEGSLVDVNGFLVRDELVPYVRCIFTKSEGVARGCLVKHSAVRGVFIEVLAQMVRVVTTNSPSSLTMSDVEYMDKGMKDLERNGFEVSWFKPYASKVAPLVEYAYTYAKLDALKCGLRDAEEQVSLYRQEVSRYESILKAKGEEASKYLAEMDSIVATDLL